MKNIYFIICLVLAMACNEYTTPVCNDTNRVDVPGFEGSRGMVLPSPDEEFTFLREEMIVERHGVGSYSGKNGEGKMSTCRVDEKLILEGLTGYGDTMTTMFFDSAEGAVFL